jgi:hypothetical protein
VSQSLLAGIDQVAAVERGEVAIESGVTYDGIRPVPVRISKRDGRYKITDDGAAVAAAGIAGRRVSFPDRIALGEYSVNVSRQGVVWLPAVAPNEAWTATLCELVARGSVALYERLLELDDDA